MDVVIAIERPGPAADGSYYTMKGLKMDPLIAPLERLFQKPIMARRIAIGDGGNEVGMGKVRGALWEPRVPAVV